MANSYRANVETSLTRLSQNVTIPEAISVTPFYKLDNLSAQLKADIWIKRDDLYPLFGGGNKARKMNRIIKTLIEQNPDIVITVGGTQSNHCRVTAIACEQLGIRCDLILHGTIEDLEHAEGNLKLCLLCGATPHFVDPDNIAETIETIRAEYQANGLKVFVLPGGGETTSGTLAYADAFQELVGQSSTPPKRIVVASGTGGTQAGLLIGAEQSKTDTEIIGISVAREHTQGSSEIARAYRDASGITINQDNIRFETDWVDGGYGLFTAQTTSASEFLRRQEGILTDYCYSGKAVAGLLALYEQEQFSDGGRTVFWHTGGIFNFMTQR